MPNDLDTVIQDEPKFVPGFPKRKCEPVKCDERFMIELKVEFDPKTGSTKPDESSKVDLVEMIQTYKDQCGMELAKKLIRIGQADPSQFRDDGKHSYDASMIPETTQARANAAVAAEKNVDAIAKELGIPDAKLTDEQLTMLIQDYINRNSSKFIKPAATPAEEVK